MPSWLSELADSALPFLQTELARDVGKALLLLVVGIPLARLLARALAALAGRVTSPARARVVRSFAWYALLFLVIASALRELGFDLSVLLGAAGVLTVALGFASQTSASNVISGLFLIVERPFEPGDFIELEGGMQGEVLSIDLMSVKLRTFDNLFVRVPNESLIKARIINLSRFPIRRIDVPIGVAYDSDLPKVKRVLEEIARDAPLILEDPPTVFNVRAFSASSVDLTFSCWTVRTDFLAARAALYASILEAFRANDIEIPFPQQVVTHKGALPRES